MKRIYKGNIRNLIVKNLRISKENCLFLEFEMPIIKKDALFYENSFGALISLDYDTRLADFNEAYDVCKEIARKHPKHLEHATCLFLNDGDTEYSHSMNKKDLKLLKKEYKAKKK